MTNRKINPPTGDFLPNLCKTSSTLLLILVAEMIAVLLTINASHLPHFSWDLLALYSIQIQWISLISALLICKMNPWLKHCHPVHAGLSCYGTVMITTLSLSAAGQFLLALLTGELALAGHHFQLNLWQLLNNLLAAAILAGIGLRYLYLQQQLRNQQYAELQARIQALQSRIRPHFLFNSMNSIASLIGSDPELAERVVENLAELFRSSLAEPTLIPMSAEILLCRRYLEIEQLRLGHRLKVDWQVGELPEALKIPSLMMQPLIENAIFHGIEPLPTGGTISIKISHSNQQLMITISNPYPLTRKILPVHEAQKNSNTGPTSRHNHMALDNIRHRLLAHYGTAARLSSSEEQGVFTTYIFCPLTL